MSKTLKFIIFLSLVCHANIFDDIDQKQAQNENKLNRTLEQVGQGVLNFGEDIRASDTIVYDEKPCFKIYEINLGVDKKDEKFKLYFNDAAKKLNFTVGSCLSEKSVQAVYNAVNNELIAQGYITSEFAIKSSNLQSGKLEFILQKGVIGQIYIGEESPQRKDAEKQIKTQSAKDRLGVWAAFGGNKRGVMLNLRDIEQALENISNPSTDANIRLFPSQAEQSTDVEIVKRQKFPINLTLSLDNGGSKETGRYQGGLRIDANDLLGLNETLTVFLAKIYSAPTQMRKAATIAVQYR